MRAGRRGAVGPGKGNELIDGVYEAIKGISTVANATNKLNMADKGTIAGHAQDILAIVAVLNVRLAEAEHEVTTIKLKVASIELRTATAASSAPTGGAATGSTEPAVPRMDYAGTLKLPKGPAVLFYPNTEGIQ